jgi:hypothetical protein
MNEHDDSWPGVKVEDLLRLRFEKDHIEVNPLIVFAIGSPKAKPADEDHDTLTCR